MRNLPNIEKSAFRRGEYVGYSRGVWRVFRTRAGSWTAVKRDDDLRAPILCAPTLADISALLTKEESR